jgi:hypothetical protein
VEYKKEVHAEGRNTKKEVHAEGRNKIRSTC